MGWQRWAKQVDKNQAIIVEILRKRGFQVDTIAKPVDLLVSKDGKFSLVEVKDPKKEGWKNEYTQYQKKFFKTWKGPPIPVIRTEEEALSFTL